MRCLLVDKIVSLEEKSGISGIKNVTMSEDFLQDHFPGFPVMPGVLQIEAVAQLGSWLVFASSGYRQKARLTSLQSVKFREFIVPGDRMHIAITLTDYSDTSAEGSARVEVDGRLKTELRRIRLDCIDVETIENAYAAREHFDFISGTSPRGAYAGGGRTPI